MSRRGRFGTILLVLALIPTLAACSQEGAGGSDPATDPAVDRAFERALEALPGGGAGPVGTLLLRPLEALSEQPRQALLGASAGPGVFGLVGAALLMGALATLLPGARKGLVFSYFVSEEAEWQQALLTGFLLALLQGGAGVVLVLIAGSEVGAAAARLAGAGLWIMLAFGVGLLVLKVWRAVALARHFKEEQILARLRSVSETIDPDHNDPAREMIFHHRREGRRRRALGGVLTPLMVLSGALAAPWALALTTAAAGSGRAGLAVGLILAAAAGAGLAYGVVAVAATLGKNGLLWLFRIRVAYQVQAGLEILGAAAITVTALVLIPWS